MFGRCRCLPTPPVASRNPSPARSGPATRPTRPCRPPAATFDSSKSGADSAGAIPEESRSGLWWSSPPSRWPCSTSRRPPQCRMAGSTRPLVLRRRAAKSAGAGAGTRPRLPLVVLRRGPCCDRSFVGFESSGFSSWEGRSGWVQLVGTKKKWFTHGVRM